MISVDGYNTSSLSLCSCGRKITPASEAYSHLTVIVVPLAALNHYQFLTFLHVWRDEVEFLLLCKRILFSIV